MALSTKPYKGTRDFYPEQKRFQNWMFAKMSGVVEGFGYQPYDGPMLEPFELYAAKTGEEIVNQQLYWLLDKSERKLAVRPEMTPTLARMVAGKLMELPKPIRWYSLPNLWRYERPQRGRVREHWQLNVDVLGGDEVLADAEILELAVEIIRAFGGEKQVQILVNHRELVDAFFKKQLQLSDSTALKTMKAVDAKSKVEEKTFLGWLDEMDLKADQIEKLQKFLDSDLTTLEKAVSGQGTEHLKKLFKILDDRRLGSYVQFDPTVMRGLDYYTGTVFEMYDRSPENNRAMFGGGRYANLIGLFGKQQLSGVGFGMGDVTLQNFLEVHQLIPEATSPVDLFITMPSNDLLQTVDQLAAQVRAAGMRVVTPLKSGKFGDQLKQASKLGARFAALLGEKELTSGKVLLKDLSNGSQKEVPLSDVAQAISKKS